MDALEQSLRRAVQNAENARIGSDAMTVPRTETMTQEEMFERAVYVSSGNQVAVLPREPDGGQRALVLTLAEFQETYLASGETVGERYVQFSTRWRKSDKRQTSFNTTLGIGRPRLLPDVEGHLVVNRWTPNKRKQPPAGYEAHVAAFLGHVAYLVPIEAERWRFLDWLAHAEQKPAQLPHHGYLLYTETFGIGRNWLSGVLARVWRGETASSVNLPQLITGGFNGVISGKRLAVVDEVHLNSSGAASYAVQNSLRQLMTEETRNVNPKYGRQFMEWNTVRWLLFSNHADAIPMPKGDRRFAVVECPSERRPEAYYVEMYARLDDPVFIASVGWWLSQRDIRKFNPGATPELNAAKLAVIEATTPEMDRALAEVVGHWESPVAVVGDLMRACGVEPGDQKAIAAFGFAMRRAGHRRLQKVRIDAARPTVWLLAGQAPPAGLEALTTAVCAYRATPWFRAAVEPQEGF